MKNCETKEDSRIILRDYEDTCDSSCAGGTLFFRLSHAGPEFSLAVEGEMSAIAAVMAVMAEVPECRCCLPAFRGLKGVRGDIDPQGKDNAVEWEGEE